ncbi:hypothetical protein MGG_13283 [Pyricularia oryzae 70-15]|uniref:AVR-Pik-like HMA interaction domain-containing protein n=1 Tax=Pyricularia oryzae (strain 70-15 / ATCC MYA-4617 / FGSC 8958) TaxID=242507 RepID=G4N3Y3_PYRO7|nr:uncharacterized protein MGG_13283 [Pyricularia oryzae 70-15]EHA51905.1 hypothetical protein MGG_13283 [Pyricularia oryzae 70-15]KAI7908438.1 hypothetical protein M9X92_012189 [Pyricularia oryzae]
MRITTLTALAIALLGNSATVGATDGGPVIQRRMYNGGYGGGYGNCPGGSCPPRGGYGGGYGGGYAGYGGGYGGGYGNCPGGSCPPRGGYGGYSASGYGGGGGYDDGGYGHSPSYGGGGGGYDDGSYEHSPSYAGGGGGYDDGSHGHSTSYGGGGGGGGHRTPEVESTSERRTESSSSRWPPGTRSEDYPDPPISPYLNQRVRECVWFWFEYAQPTTKSSGGWFRSGKKKPTGPKQWIMREAGEMYSGHTIRMNVGLKGEIPVTSDEGCDMSGDFPTGWTVVGRRRKGY